MTCKISGYSLSLEKENVNHFLKYELLQEQVIDFQAKNSTGKKEKWEVKDCDMLD